MSTPAGLYDGQRDHPDIARVIAWDRLENSRSEPHPAVVAATLDKVAAIAEAQAQGRLTARFDARQLLILVQGVALMWDSLPDDVTNQLAGHDDHERRRRTIVDAVRRLATVS